MRNLKKIIKETIRQYLNEQVENNKSRYFSRIGLSTEDVFDLIYYYDTYRDLYPGYSDDNEYEEEYYYPTMDDAYNEVNNTLEFFNELPEPLTIYRSIKVKSLDDIDYENLGESWSYDKQSAINFAYNQAGGNVLLVGKTNFENINWEETLRLYFEFSNGYDTYNEDEIRVIDSDKIFDIEADKIKK
jgi:hypothetical protein